MAGDGAGHLHFWGLQIEASSAASAHMPTTGAQTTQSADACSFSIPPGVFSLRYTFDDESTQTVVVSPGFYTIPTDLNRSRIKRIVSV